MPVTCHSGHACVIGNDIYLLGGAVTNQGDATFVDFIQVYSTERRTWTVLNAVCPNRQFFPVAYRQTIVCFGGKEEEEDLSDPGLLEENVDDYGEAYISGEAAPLFTARSACEAFMNKPVVEVGMSKKKSKKKNKQNRKPQFKLPPSPLLTPASQRIASLTFETTDPRDEVWSLHVPTLKWTQLPSAAKPHYPYHGYFYVDDTVVRDALNTDLNFNLETQLWEDDPGRAVLHNHKM